MVEQDELSTDEMRGIWQDEAAAHRIFAMWALLNRCVRLLDFTSEEKVKWLDCPSMHFHPRWDGQSS